MTVYNVKAKHPADTKYDFVGTVTVKREEDFFTKEVTFYASAAKLGCGKNCQTQNAAIRYLFNVNALTITECVKVEG